MARRKRSGSKKIGTCSRKCSAKNGVKGKRVRGACISRCMKKGGARKAHRRSRRRC